MNGVAAFFVLVVALLAVTVDAACLLFAVLDERTEAKYWKRRLNCPRCDHV